MEDEHIYIDELTNVYNKRYLKEKKVEQLEKFITLGVSFSVVWIDIDRFKDINDSYGHLKGDEVLKEFAQFLKKSLRVKDTIIRFGGDEFICIMPNTRRQNSRKVYERIVKNCREKEFAGLHITMSAGIASFPDDGKNFDKLIKISDDALYNAKRSGRDTIGVVTKKRIEIPIKIFIDRFNESENLRKLMDGNGTVRFGAIKGMIGIGKTRLVREVLGGLRNREIVWSDCIAFMEGVSYYAIRELIKYKIERKGKEILKHIHKIYRLEIAKLVPELMETEIEEADIRELMVDKYRLYESVKRLFEFSENGQIIVIDNAQWIDKESTEVIKYIMRAMKDTPIVFLLIFRTEETIDLLTHFMTFISRETDFIDILLQPFQIKEVKSAIRSIIGEEPQRELLEYIMNESGGNPFYIEEIMRGLVNRRYLELEDDTWVFKHPEGEIVPKSIEDIAMWKYRSLDEETRNILDIASVIGRFDVSIIKKITSYNEGHIIGLVNNAIALGLAKEEKGNILFSEGVSRKIIYKKNIVGIKETEIHQKVGDIIEEEKRGNLRAYVDELAYHFYKARDKEKGVLYCIEAGDRANEKYANYEAIQYYEWAIKLLEDEKDVDVLKRKLRSYIKIIDLLITLGECEKALKYIDEAYDCAKTTGDKQSVAEVVIKKATLYNRITRLNESIEEAQKALKILVELDDKKFMSSAYNILGINYDLLGQLDKAKEKFEKAIEFAQQKNDEHGKIIAMINLSSIYFRLSEMPKVISICQEAIRFAREKDDKRNEASILNLLAGVYQKEGEYHLSLEMMGEALKIAQEIGRRPSEIRYYLNMSSIYSRLGEYEKTIELCKTVINLLGTTGEKYIEYGAYLDLGTVYRVTGNFKEAMSCFEEALRIAEEYDLMIRIAEAKCEIGTVYTGTGELDKGWVILEEALDIAEKTKSKQTIRLCLLGMGNLNFFKGDYESALKYYKEANESVKKEKDVVLLVEIKSSLIKVYLKQKRYKKVESLVNEGLLLIKGLISKFEVIGFLLLVAEWYLEDENYTEYLKLLPEFNLFKKEIKTKRFLGGFNLLQGCYFTVIGEYGQAEEHLGKSRYIYEKYHDAYSLGEVFLYFGKSAQARSQDEKAIEYLKKALEIFSSYGAQAREEETKEILEKY